MRFSILTSSSLLWVLSLAAGCGSGNSIHSSTGMHGFASTYTTYDDQSYGSGVMITGTDFCAGPLGSFAGPLMLVSFAERNRDEDTFRHATEPGTYRIGATDETAEAGQPIRAAAATFYDVVGGVYNHQQSADVGSVKVDSIDVGQHVAGHFDLHFGNEHITGSFDTGPCH
jgi:hypothetical protein